MKKEKRRARVTRRLNGETTARRRYPIYSTGDLIGMGVGFALFASIALFVPGDIPGGIAAMALRAVVLLPLVKTGIISESQFMDWGVMAG